MLFINHYPSVPDPGFPRWGTPTPEDGVKTDYYHPQTKFAKVMFLHLSLSHSVHRGGGVPGQVHPPDRYTPLGRYTPRQAHPLVRYTPQDRYTFPWQVHPLGRYTPLVGSPPRSSACWETRATSGRYAPTGMHSCFGRFLPKTA